MKIDFHTRENEISRKVGYQYIAKQLFLDGLLYVLTFKNRYSPSYPPQYRRQEGKRLPKSLFLLH